MSKNKFGLSREELSEDIKDKLRKEVNYVCPARDANGQCNSIFLTWHHFDPPFTECKKHDPNGIIALCHNHHDRADTNEYSISELRSWKENPNIKSIFEISTKVPFLHRADLHVNIANAFLKHNRANIICGNSYINIRKDDNGILLFNLKITNRDGTELFYLKDNVFSPVTKNVKIQCGSRSLKINIKSLNEGNDTNLHIYGIRLTEENYEKIIEKQSKEFINRIRKVSREWEKRRRQYMMEEIKEGNLVPNIEEIVDSIKQRNPLEYNIDNTEFIYKLAEQLREEYKKQWIESLNITDKSFEDHFPSEDNVISKLKDSIHIGSMLVFIKGQIYYDGGYADFDNAFTSGDNSTIISLDPFIDPDIEMGSNYVASRSI